MTRNVSITFQNTDDARAIIEAIKTDNPNATAADFPSMVKIDCPGQIVINAETVSAAIGRDWDPQEIHLSIITLSGSIDEDDDRFVIQWN